MPVRSTSKSMVSVPSWTFETVACGDRLCGWLLAVLDSGPARRTVRSQVDVPLGRVRVPRHCRTVGRDGLALRVDRRRVRIARAVDPVEAVVVVGQHRRLVGEGLDEVAVLDLVDLPRRALGDRRRDPGSRPPAPWPARSTLRSSARRASADAGHLARRRGAPYGRFRCAHEHWYESSRWSMKWNGVVVDDSKYRPSIDPMQPSLNRETSIGAIGVPYRSSTGSSYSHINRPQP